MHDTAYFFMNIPHSNTLDYNCLIFDPNHVGDRSGLGTFSMNRMLMSAFESTPGKF